LNDQSLYRLNPGAHSPVRLAAGTYAANYYQISPFPYTSGGGKMRRRIYLLLFVVLGLPLIVFFLPQIVYHSMLFTNSLGLEINPAVREMIGSIRK
jgi:hypothetical protein